MNVQRLRSKKQPRVRRMSVLGVSRKAAWGQRLETGTEVGKGVLGPGHIQAQVAAAVTHFLLQVVLW